MITASYDYEGQYLKMASLQGDGFATLLLSRSSSGSGGNLVTVAADGTPYGSLTLDGSPWLWLPKGHDVALLTTSEVITADRRLDGYRTTPNQQGIRNVAVYSDGSVALINSAAVSLYFPFTGTRVEADAANQENG